MSIPVMKRFRRKSVFLYGHACIFIIFMIAGVATFYNNAVITMICIFLFEFIYCCTVGTIFWIYAAEISTDIGLGIAIFAK